MMPVVTALPDFDEAVATAANLAAREVLQHQHKSRLSTSCVFLQCPAGPAI